MPEFQNQNVLITGPTSGIGYDLAYAFAEAKANLVLVSRNRTKLDQMSRDLMERHGVTCRVFQKDLSRPGSAAELVREVENQGIQVDVLVNNAGYGVYGKFHEAGLEAQMGMIELHVTSLSYLTHAFLQGMLKRNRGGVLNVASTGGFQPVPIENVYCATKAYAVNFTVALAEELRETGVHITCLCPGPTDTAFFSQPLMNSWKPKFKRMSSLKVAQMGFEAFRKGQNLVVTGWMNKILILGSKFAPRNLVVRSARKVVERRS